MKHSGKIVLLFSFCCLALIFMSGDAYAADVLQTVRDKAASFIKSLRPLIFILAGFGLIGFAFGAIFGKISWKWFANIAIGLFLVANVGLFIDYFATRSGAAGQYAQDLGYGKYLDASGGYTPTNGSSSDPQSQKTPSESGDGQDNSSSENADSTCVPGTGTGCEKNYFENVNEDLLNPNQDLAMQNCSMKGGVWNSALKRCEEKGTAEEINDTSLAAENEENQARQSCQLTGGTWNSATKSCEPGGNAPGWGGIGINSDSSETANADAATTPSENQAENVSNLFNQLENDEQNWDVDGGELDGVEVVAKDYSKEKQSCQLTGGTWNSSTMSCEKDNSNMPGWNGIGISGNSEDQANSDTSGGNSGTEDSSTENSGTDTPSNEPKQNQTDTEKQQCTANNGYWDGEKCITSSAGVDMSKIKEVITVNGRQTGVTENGRYVDLATGEEDTFMDLIDADGNEWLYNKETQEYFNPKTGETTTAEMLRAEGPVYDADQYKENQEKRACMLKFSKGYSWVNGKCLTPEETAEKEAQEQKEKEEKTKKYCKEGQEYIGEGDMTGPICVDTEETKAKKKAEQEEAKKKAEQEEARKKAEQEEAEYDAPLEDEAMTEVDCRSLELECKNKYAAAIEACDAGTERMTQKEWCQKNPSKCAYENREYDNMAKKPKDAEDYNKYIEEMYEEKRRCEEARLDTCHFDRTPSEETYCERYPSRCTEVKTGSTQDSGMYPTGEGKNDYRAYVMEVAQNKKNLEKCKEAAGDAADKCYAACSK